MMMDFINTLKDLGLWGVILSIVIFAFCYPDEFKHIVGNLSKKFHRSTGEIAYLQVNDLLIAMILGFILGNAFTFKLTFPNVLALCILSFLLINPEDLPKKLGKKDRDE